MEWDRDNKAPEREKIEYIKEMQEQMEGICEQLSIETRKFRAENFFEKMYKYISNNERLLYNSLTDYIFLLKDEEFVIVEANIEQVLCYMKTDQCYNKYINKNSERKNNHNKEQTYRFFKTQKTILKMWDHVNLARKQMIMFHQSNEDYKVIVDQKMELAEAKISKEINGQLISLIGIFTALSFLAFGGISSLDNIFIGAQNIPILKLMIVGLIWCFSIMNLVFVFMFFVGKLTKLSLKSTEDVNANFIQKYPLISWSNFAIGSMLIITCWIYFIRRSGYHHAIEKFIFGKPLLGDCIGSILILVCLIFIACKIYQGWTKEPITK